ncbi:MAG: RND transporter [Gammaproteobacteria bacterium]|nr:MAG: RND transporter [Gammaproteobacteria bacterium]
MAVALLGALSGCSLSPPYQRPTVPAAPDSYKEAGEWKLATPADATARGRWWTMYQDRELDELEAQATDSNQSLRAALARLDQARAQTRMARAAWFPTLTAQANATRSQTSLNSPTYTPGKPPVGNVFTAGADASYELDVFGRVRNTLAGARASEQASAGDVAALDLSVRAELASDYFTLRGLDIEQQLLDHTVTGYARALQLTQNLYHGGAAAIADVQQAQAQLESARTQAEETRLRRAQTEHAIAVLVGRQPADFSIAARSGGADLPVPEVAAAYFPVFSLLGTAGVQSTSASDWIGAPSRFWSVGPQALMTLFDGGLHTAQSAAAHAAYDEQVANYRGTVLTAFQDVEDNLAALRQLQRESVSQAAAVTATQGALDQANLRYKGGLVTYLEVVSTENAALAAHLAAVDISIRRTNATVLLVKALGGDWQRR